MYEGCAHNSEGCLRVFEGRARLHAGSRAHNTIYGPRA